MKLAYMHPLDLIEVNKGGRRVYGIGRPGARVHGPVVRVQGIDAGFLEPSYAPGQEAAVMVSTDANGYKQVNYSGLPYLMLQAIRELKTENDTLRGQVEQLKEEQTEIRQLRADVERLTASEKAQPPALSAAAR